MAHVSEDRVNVLGARTGGQGFGELVKVGAGDLVNPLVLKALKGVLPEKQVYNLEK